MKWPNKPAADLAWGREISNRAAKELAALRLAKRLKDGDTVGVGSGSTSFLTLIALARRREEDKLAFQAIPTSIEMELACAALGISTTTLKAARPDWCFDGADEVDPKGNMIKGRGGAMLREKLVMSAAERIYIVIDSTKQVSRLGQKFPVPVEVHPEAIQLIETSLGKLPDVKTISLRQAVAKDGPVITEHGNVIFDVKFSKIDVKLEKTLKALPGVVESGLFIGFAPHIISIKT